MKTTLVELLLEDVPPGKQILAIALCFEQYRFILLL